jgi:hypothetical protein
MQSSSYFDLALTLLNLGLSAYAIGKVLNSVRRPRYFWLGFLCLGLSMLLGSLSWLTVQIPAITPLTRVYLRGPLALLALILIVRFAPMSATSTQQ